jgi:hypothetical protein
MYSHHFSINNIPFGIASSASHPEKAVATRLEDIVIFLDELAIYDPSLPSSIVATFSHVGSSNLFSNKRPTYTQRKHSTPSPPSPNPLTLRRESGYNPTSPLPPPCHHQPPHPSHPQPSTSPLQSEISPTSPAPVHTCSTRLKPYLENATCLLDSSISL